MSLSIAVALGSVGVLVGLIYLGMHVGVALTLVSFAGVWLIRGNLQLAMDLLALSVSDAVATYSFGVIPLFVLMGFVVSEANFGRDLFDVTNRVFRRVKGGLGLSTIAANAGFAAITGVSIASASVFTRIAVPQMLRFGYSPRFAVGLVAGSSVLGMLIPPSVLMILYGILTDVSIGRMFIAGILPGIGLAAVFAIGTVVAVRLWPGLVGAPEEGSAEPGAGASVLKLLPIIALVMLVLGGIYQGFFTATEAAGIGAGASLVIALAMGRLDRAALWRILRSTASVTASICFLLIAASLYSRMLAFSGLPGAFQSWVTGSELGFMPLLLVYMGVLLVLGTILDSTSIMLITVPVMIPVLTALNPAADPIWLGILVIVATEVGIITPPLGIAVFVINDTLDDPRVKLGDIFAGALPFALAMVVFLALLIAFPQISLALL